ncbi:MAG: tRNA lysidine(34) synthetase TilS [Sarcina sp.]
MQEKVLQYIKKNSMIEENDKVLVALSGGPDSICLLHILKGLENKLNIKILAAHINHCLRGNEADKDEEYARKFCENLGIDFYVKRIEIDKVAKEKKISTEMAGREERYKFFDELKKKFNIQKIAIAHNANDQAETLIMRIARGTGIEGLVGIRPVRDNLFIRPILCLTREEIESYCEDNNLNPRIDKTNLEEVYSRNKIRLKAIPFLKENFNEDVIDAFNRLAYSVSKDVEFINEFVEEKYNTLIENTKDGLIIKREAFDEKEAVLNRLIRKALMEVSGAFNNFEMKHINDVINLQNGNAGKKINLTNRVIVINEYGKIKIVRDIKRAEFKDEITFDIEELYNMKEKIITNNLGTFTFKVVENNGNIKTTKNNEKYFSFDNVSKITIRTRKDGDTIVPFGMEGRKKLKDIFINNKIPKEERNFIPLLLLDDEVAWIIGVRNSNLYKFKKENKRLLKVTCERREY